MFPLISVIIPVYNVKGYIARCLESVVLQTYQNLEIVVIDDGSEDGSGNICESYKKQDTRIKVYHKTNGGLSDARNFGLDRCRGEYVAFVDGDDVVAPDYIEYLYFLITKGRADISSCGIIPFIEKEPVNKLYKKNQPLDIVCTEDMLKRMAMQISTTHSACNKLFKASLWADIRFPDVLYEDYAIIYYLVSHAKRCVVGKDAKLYYRQRSSSIMGRKFSDNQLVLLDIADKVTDWMIEQYPSTYEEALRMKMVAYCSVLKSMIEANANHPEIKDRIVRWVRGIAPEMLRFSNIRMSDKVKVSSLCISKRLFYWLVSIREIVKRCKMQ